jgi:hypothetical protein
MIDKVVYKNTPLLDISTIPDIFANFLLFLLDKIGGMMGMYPMMA